MVEKGFKISNTVLFALLMFFFLIMYFLNMVINHKLTFFCIGIIEISCLQKLKQFEYYLD